MCQRAVVQTHSRLLCADTAVGPFVLAVKRFGATFKEFPNLAKYAVSLEVKPLACLPSLLMHLALSALSSILLAQPLACAS